MPHDYRVFAYGLSGSGLYGEDRQRIDAQSMVVFSNDGDSITLAAGDEPLDVLLFGGVPLNEPRRPVRPVCDEHPKMRFARR